eukprot:Clim_evm109s11 gene=Clim_evmTU109s11
MAANARIELDEVTQHNVNQLRLLNTAVYPVKYGPAFYKDAWNNKEIYSRLAFYQDIVVGGVVAKPTDEGLCIMTLGCLGPYRQLGVGKKMLDWIMEQAENNKSVTRVYCQVQKGNDAAIKFYGKAGFTQCGTLPNYYKRVEPSEALVFEKKIDRS